MSRSPINWASLEMGTALVDFSSEVIGCEAINVLDARISKIWLTCEGLPQWLCLSLANVHPEGQNIVIRTIGWHCWHPYTSNPKTILIHVSSDGSKFKLWDHLSSKESKGTQLFCCTPINSSVYPYIAFEIKEAYGGSQTYMNRIYLYSEEMLINPSSSNSATEGYSHHTSISDFFDRVGLYETRIRAWHPDDNEIGRENNTRMNAITTGMELRRQNPPETQTTALFSNREENYSGTASDLNRARMSYKIDEFVADELGLPPISPGSNRYAEADNIQDLENNEIVCSSTSSGDSLIIEGLRPLGDNLAQSIVNENDPGAVKPFRTSALPANLALDIESEASVRNELNCHRDHSASELQRPSGLNHRIISGHHSSGQLISTESAPDLASLSYTALPSDENQLMAGADAPQFPFSNSTSTAHQDYPSSPPERIPSRMSPVPATEISPATPRPHDIRRLLEGLDSKLDMMTGAIENLKESVRGPSGDRPREAERPEEEPHPRDAHSPQCGQRLWEVLHSPTPRKYFIRSVNPSQSNPRVS